MACGKDRTGADGSAKSLQMETFAKKTQNIWSWETGLEIVQQISINLFYQVQNKSVVTGRVVAKQRWPGGGRWKIMKCNTEK